MVSIYSYHFRFLLLFIQRLLLFLIIRSTALSNLVPIFMVCSLAILSGSLVKIIVSSISPYLLPIYSKRFSSCFFETPLRWASRPFPYMYILFPLNFYFFGLGSLPYFGTFRNFCVSSVYFLHFWSVESMKPFSFLLILVLMCSCYPSLSFNSASSNLFCMWCSVI